MYDTRTLHLDAIRALQPSWQWQREHARHTHVLGHTVPINPMAGASEEWRWDVHALAQLTTDEIVSVYASLKNDDATRHYDVDSVG